MHNTPFTIYKSSAGSGKTYTLTMEYLKLALVFPAAFRMILAVTFTNKATQEMKERILKELSRLKRQVDPTQTMDRELLTHLGVDSSVLMQRAGSALSAILHDYAAFSVSTIDSFFQRIIRSFAREIDLQAKFDLELDQDGVLDRLVERLILTVTEDPFLHKWLIDYSIEQIQEGKSWDIRRNIKSLGSQLFQEAFKRYRFQIQTFLQDDANLDALKQQVIARRRELIAEGRALKSQATVIRERHGLQWEDFKGSSRSFALKFDALGNPQTPFPLLSPTQIGLEDRPEAWFTKSSQQAHQIQAAFADGLGAIWGQIQPLYVAWITSEAVRKNLDVFGIFKFLLRELDDLKEEENILLISDSNEFLREITADNEAPFIYEKVGYKYRHYLIDEFQDTSGFQWDSFRPLLIDSLSQGYANLLVGDVKQSIYRWRGGELRLLLDQVEAEIYQFGLEIKNLDTNFRSLPHVVKVNNAVFTHLPDQLAGVLERKFEVEDAGILARAYQDVRQQVAPFKTDSAYGGVVRVAFLAAEESEEKFTEMALAKVPQMVIDLQEKGYRPRDIAFLVRTKKEGVKIADQLISFGLANPSSPYSFDVVSDEAMLVSRSSTVSCVVSALKYLADKEEAIHLKTMWYHWAIIFGHPVSHDLFGVALSIPEIEAMQERFDTLKEELLQMQLLDLVERLISFLGLQRGGSELAYLEAFKEAVYDFVSVKRADLPGFLTWWESQLEKRTIKIPEDHDAMRILTIHKSKGLQFKVVLMPFLDWKIFDTAKDQIVWTPYSAYKLGQEVVIPLSMSSKLMESDFRPVYQEEAMLAFLDSLNMVYVAMTRAEEVFWAFAPATQTANPQYGNLASNLEAVFQASTVQVDQICLGDYFDVEQGVFQFGDWPPHQKQVPGAYLPYPLRWESRSWEELLTVKAMATDFSEDNLKLRLKGTFGTLVHGLLEKSRGSRDIFLGLEDLYYEGFINQEERDTLREQLRHLLQSPQFSRWFGEEGEVLSEQGILLPNGTFKRPDRILLFPDHAEVIDFKTGLQREFHTEQVGEYMKLVGELTGSPVKGYLCYLDEMAIVEIEK
ncbi:MAG: UvrD-helicase domain-containing protein [Lunatimonas sp.]|uniref:UvrD-helicase domain-containing protein n=1 Tax=Lunatimonas sp. TaxID=2060141 RepID=UPI00263A4F0F|nr:UvrD-helicase domain-containing protein [Lunatimonas sp.]MCC5938686.1 UvrD-helicase domain-containing protein [Lunatimonas sp.]